MKRREFITLLGGGALGWPLAARGQQTAGVKRIGVLMSVGENDLDWQPHVTAFDRRLKELGWADGRNLRIEYRWGAGNVDRMRVHAAELVGLAPDLILANSAPVLAVVQQETRAIPIVFVQVADPIAGGFVASLARPGGNITGFTSFEEMISAKWLELLKQAAPQISRVAIVRNQAATSASNYFIGAIASAAPSLGVQLTIVDVRDAAAIERAFDAFVGESIGGVIAMPDPIFSVNRERFIALAALHRLPAVYYYRYFATSGGLMSYGPDTVDLYRQAASYVDRILRGTKPADLPVQQPTKFEFVINLQTAKALGLDVPTTLLARADEVIE
jgi:putative tryptophan/tyrosine transport system substrate-binding protein